MAENGLNVRLTDPLRRFVEERVGSEGLYESAGEYIRDLVRRDYEHEEQRRWSALMQHIQPGIDARDDAFVDFDCNAIIEEARRESADDAA